MRRRCLRRPPSQDRNETWSQAATVHDLAAEDCRELNLEDGSMIRGERNNRKKHKKKTAEAASPVATALEGRLGHLPRPPEESSGQVTEEEPDTGKVSTESWLSSPDYEPRVDATVAALAAGDRLGVANP